MDGIGNSIVAALVGIYQSNPPWLGHAIDSISTILTLLGIVVSAWAVVWQLRTSHRQSLRLQQTEHQNQLFLQIYSEMAEVVRRAQSSMSRAGGKVAWTATSVELYWTARDSGTPPVPIGERIQELSELNQSAIDGFGEVIFVIEKYEIAVPALKSFVTQTKDEHEALRTRWRNFVDTVWRFLPYDVTHPRATTVITHTVDPNRPDPNELNLVRQAARDYQSKAMDYVGYYMDLSRALQHILLGDIFEHRLDPRRPDDPTVKVLKFGD